MQYKQVFNTFWNQDYYNKTFLRNSEHIDTGS